MNVFADLHQDDLYYSLHLLFEKRLGWNLYRPIGFEWEERGLWKYSPKTEVIEQYLQVYENDKDLGDHWECPEVKHSYSHKALTFEQFLNKDIDIIIASVKQHELPYFQLVKEFKPKAKLIRQIGNIHDTADPEICKNIMASALVYNVPSNVNLVIYHQEFELTTFSFKPPYKGLRITNLMNCLPDSRDFYLWKEYKKNLKEFDWKMYGILGDDGIIGTEEKVAEAFHNSTFIWHVKYGGDGFGHVIHNAFATGRPPIVIGNYYKDTLAGFLIEDNKTCIELEKRDLQGNIEKIRYWAKPENYQKMSKAAYDRFRENVDYDKEFKLIKKFLYNLI